MKRVTEYSDRFYALIRRYFTPAAVLAGTYPPLPRPVTPPATWTGAGPTGGAALALTYSAVLSKLARLKSELYQTGQALYPIAEMLYSRESPRALAVEIPTTASLNAKIQEFHETVQRRTQLEEDMRKAGLGNLIQCGIGTREKQS